MKLVGYKKFISKNGNACAYLYVSDNFRQDEVQKYGAIGTKVEVISCYDQQVFDSITPEMVNKNIRVDYNVVNNRPYVSGVSVV